MTIVVAPTVWLFFAPGTPLKVLAGCLLAIEGMVCIVVTVCILLYSLFLHTAFFRASYGYTLEAPYPAAPGAAWQPAPAQPRVETVADDFDPGDYFPSPDGGPAPAEDADSGPQPPPGLE